MRTLLFLLLLVPNLFFGQYIAVKAKYTETRLVDDAPNPPKRENRLVLTFYEVTPAGVHTPAYLTDYDIWVYEYGLQFAGGGALDSSGNNYPGYSYTAPRVVSYNNTRGLNFIDCDPNIARHFVVNGNTLDCGFVTVSYWTYDWGTMIPFEAFHAPYVCLPLYPIGHPYYYTPGNLNFGWNQPWPWCCVQTYNWFCGTGPLELITKGALPGDTGSYTEPLPVRFANLRGEINTVDTASIFWSNMTESHIAGYTIERSLDNMIFEAVATVSPASNNGGRADYIFKTLQSGLRAWYRIKAIELDGTFFYSPVIELTRTVSYIDNTQSFSIYPNPVSGSTFTFRLTNAKRGRYISIVVSPEGRELRQKLVMHNGGDLVREVDLFGLPAGIYQFVLRGEGRRHSQKIIYVR